MKRESLQYYIHDEPEALRFELSGSLSGAGAQSVYQAWRTALSILGVRPVIADITFVVEADESGRDVLLVWHRSGVRIIAASRESQALAEPILGVRIPAPPAKAGWLRRSIAALFGDQAARAGILAPAESRPALSARAQRRRAESTADNDLARAEYRLH
jgi:hypothetical protein